MAVRSLTIEEMKSVVGQELGVSDWHAVTQPDVNAFADVTHDHQWIHIDVERAKKESPFGGPVAHGYFTLSLAPGLVKQIWSVTDARMGLNYGLNKLRFPSPVPVGARVRVRATLLAAEDVPGGLQVTINLVFEIEGAAKPGCAAEAVYRYYA
jgi:acyl dehydratase